MFLLLFPKMSENCFQLFSITSIFHDFPTFPLLNHTFKKECHKQIKKIRMKTAQPIHAGFSDC